MHKIRVVGCSEAGKETDDRDRHEGSGAWKPWLVAGHVGRRCEVGFPVDLMDRQDSHTGRRRWKVAARLA